MATSAPIRIAGKSCPTTASAIASDRAKGFSGSTSPKPTVVSVVKLKYTSFDVSWSTSAGADVKWNEPAWSCSTNWKAEVHASPRNKYADTPPCMRLQVMGPSRNITSKTMRAYKRVLMMDKMLLNSCRNLVGYKCESHNTPGASNDKGNHHRSDNGLLFDSQSSGQHQPDHQQIEEKAARKSGFAERVNQENQ